MAFDFGAALSSAGDVGPAYQQAQAGIKDEKELAAERQRAAQEFSLSQRSRTASTVAQEQRNKQWVPMRSYKAGDGSSHTVYFTPEGLKDEMDEPDQLTQRKQYVDTLNKMGVPVTDLQKSEYLLTGTLKSQPRDRIHFGQPLPKDPNNPGGDWVQEVTDSDTGSHLYDVPAYPPSRYLGTTGSSTTYNPQFGMDITTNRTTQRTLPGQTTPLGTPTVGGGPTQPPSRPGAPQGVAPTIHQLGQQPGRTPRPSLDSMNGGAPPILRYPAMNADIRARADSLASLQQQFVGSGNDPLWNYADLLDDKAHPGLPTAINKALTMTMMPVTQQSAEASGPISALSRAMGITQAAVGFAQEKDQQAITQARNAAVQMGGPRALELIDRLAELKGSIPVMRKISSASAAQGSIAPLIQESPALNTASPEDFRKRIALSMRTIAAAVAADPSINPAYAKWFFQQAMLADPRSGTPKSASGGVIVVSPEDMK